MYYLHSLFYLLLRFNIIFDILFMFSKLGANLNYLLAFVTTNLTKILSAGKNSIVL